MPLNNAHFILLTVKLLHTLAITKCSLMRFPPSNGRSTGRHSCVASSLLHSPPSHEVIGSRYRLVSQCCCHTAACGRGWRETLIPAPGLRSEGAVIQLCAECVTYLQYRTCPVLCIMVPTSNPTLATEFKSKNANLFNERLIILVY